MTPHTAKRTKRPFAAFAFKMPFMIDCVTFESFIIDYFNDALTYRQKLVFDVHLRMCRECRDYLEAYKSTVTLTREQAEIPYSDMDMGDVPEDLIKAVLKAAKEQ